MGRDNKNIGQDRYYGLERMLTFILLLAFGLAIATGILSFIRLNNIIDNVKTGVRPDRSLILAKDIFSNLTEAENSVKSYSLTQQEEDMVRFYSLTETTGEQMAELKDISMEDPYLIILIDSLDQLVSTKFEILDQLLVIQDEYLVKQAMHEVMRNIRAQEKAGMETAEVLTVDTVAEEKQEKRDNFFRRLFSKNRKKEEQASDTIVTVEPPPPGLTLEEISRQVERAQQKTLTHEKIQREQELELFRQDQLVMVKIRELLDEMETLEDIKLKTNILLAEEEASEVKTIIMSYGLAALALLLLVAIVIFIYIRRNKEYRRVLRVAKADAEELARQKQQFLANMSHEIRTPMNVMSGYLGQVMQGKLDPGQQKKLEVIRKSADHLLQLLNNLLDLSKIQAGKLELLDTEFDPREIMEYVEQFFAPTAREKGLEFETIVRPGIPTLLGGDPVRLRQILFNLTGNAIKFTQNGRVTISLSPAGSSQGTQEILIEVADTGIGISPENHRKIFDEFEQAGLSTDKVNEGSGLGLSITHKLVQLLNGKLELESEPGKGSVFRLTIPFRTVETSGNFTEAPAIKEKVGLKGLKVLVVDDEAYNRNLIRMILSKHQCHVIEAESGEDAVEKVANEEIDIILMDLRMPGMSGAQAAAVIREKNTGSGKPIPVILLSAGISKTDTENFEQNGIDAYIPKPLDEKQLIHTIFKWVRKSGTDIIPSKNEAGKSNTKENSTGKAAYDLSALRKSSAGNQKFFRDMILLFIENTSSGLQDVRQHLEKGDWQAVSDLAHKISAPCKHLGAAKLHALLKEIEENADQKTNIGQTAELVRQAIAEFNLIREDILADTGFDEN